MFKRLALSFCLLALCSTTPTFAVFEEFLSCLADSCYCGSSDFSLSLDLEGGWRRDILDWKVTDLKSHYSRAKVKDHLHFKDINSYMIAGGIKWIAPCYYVKASADYGWVDKGRAHEHFDIHSRYLSHSVDVHTSNPIKRGSEVYDFSAAVGYPFAFLNCRLSLIPLIGFSYSRQHLRVKTDAYASHSYEDAQVLPQHKEPFHHRSRSSLFSSPSDPNIARALGLSASHQTETYRFTWYGFYFGADMALAMNSCWTLFWNTEFHVCDNCHRKRDSSTGVYFVDDYHKKSSAYGFNNSVGATCFLYSNWFATAAVDFNWWKADGGKDSLYWNNVAAKLAINYAF